MSTEQITENDAAGPRPGPVPRSATRAGIQYRYRPFAPQVWAAACQLLGGEEEELDVAGGLGSFLETAFGLWLAIGAISALVASCGMRVRVTAGSARTRSASVYVTGTVAHKSYGAYAAKVLCESHQLHPLPGFWS